MPNRANEYKIEYDVPEELEKRLRDYQLRSGDVQKFKDDVVVELSHKALLNGSPDQDFSVKNLSVQHGAQVKGDATLEKDLSVKGNAALEKDLVIKGKLTVEGDMIAKDTDHMIGDVLLGDQDGDSVTISGLLQSSHSSGNLEINDALHVSENLAVDGDANLEKDLSVKGDADVTGDLSVKGDATLEKDISVKGDATLEKGLSVKGNGDVTGDLSVKGNSSLGDGDGDAVLVTGAMSSGHSSGNLEINDALHVSENLAVDGDANLEKDLSVTGDADVTGDLSVKGNSSWGDGDGDAVLVTGAMSSSHSSGNLEINDALHVSENLAVDGNANLEKDLSVKGDATLGKDISVKGDATLEKDLSVKGDADVTGDLSVKGNSSLGDGDGAAVLVTGAMSSGHSSGNLEINDALHVSENLAVDGDANLEKDLSVKGDAALEKDLSVKGNATLEKDISVKGDATLEKGLSVKGNADVTGDLSVKGNSSWGDGDGDAVLVTGAMSSSHSSGNLEINDALHVSENLAVDGDATLGGGLSITGNVKSASVATGNITASGAATAANFLGKGFGLTDLNADHISQGVLNPDRVPGLSADKIVSEKLAPDRIPDLDAGRIASGIFSKDRIPALNADKIVAGKLPIDRIPGDPNENLGSSDSVVPTQKAVKHYVDHHKSGVIDIDGAPPLWIREWEMSGAETEFDSGVSAEVWEAGIIGFRVEKKKTKDPDILGDEAWGGSAQAYPMVKNGQWSVVCEFKNVWKKTSAWKVKVIFIRKEMCKIGVDLSGVE